MIDRIPEKRARLELPSLGALVQMNKDANMLFYMSGLSLMGTLAKPMVAAPTAAAFAVIGIRMKYNSAVSFTKTMASLKSTESRSAGARQLVMSLLAERVTGGCAFNGMREAYKRYYGANWSEEFRKLKFPNMLEEEDDFL